MTNLPEWVVSGNDGEKTAARWSVLSPRQEVLEKTAARIAAYAVETPGFMVCPQKQQWPAK